MKKIKPENIMNKRQAEAMVNFHRRHYSVYKTLGHTEQAEQARKRMIQMYLKLRSFR